MLKFVCSEVNNFVNSLLCLRVWFIIFIKFNYFWYVRNYIRIGCIWYVGGKIFMKVEWFLFSDIGKWF